MRDFPASAFCDVRSQSLLLLLAVLLLLLILLLLLMLGAKEREPFPLTLVAATPALVSRTEVGEMWGGGGRSPRTGDLPLLLLLLLLKCWWWW